MAIGTGLTPTVIDWILRFRASELSGNNEFEQSICMLEQQCQDPEYQHQYQCGNDKSGRASVDREDLYIGTKILKDHSKRCCKQ